MCRNSYSIYEKTADILEQFSGYPDLPNGRPSGILAYTIANETSLFRFARSPDGVVRRLATRDVPSSGEEFYDVNIPFFSPSSRSPRRLYYAVIETNPTEVVVATFPKGTQDAHVVGERLTATIEFGQKRQLVDLLKRIATVPDLSEFSRIRDRAAAREAELNRLHTLVVESLLAYGCDVSVEPMFVAGERETREEHGFDFTRERQNVVRLDEFVELATSKRRPNRPIEHYVYAALVNGFESTLPQLSTIVEEKNPYREGNRYYEKGVFLTLPEMWDKLRRAEKEVDQGVRATDDPSVAAELMATESRLRLMERLERSLVKVLQKEGITVHTDLGAGPEASIRHSLRYSATLAAGLWEPTTERQPRPMERV
jgi:hypothetical protein